jgi:Domain of unknown function (DUF4314)
MENHSTEEAALDVQGARLLAARIRAGVRIGSQIEFTGITHERLRPGDRGVVKDIVETGDILVDWDRGFALQIDPDTTPFQPLAA